MIDYNDGEWHAWSGGDCPVHPETLVDTVFTDGQKRERRTAGSLYWKTPNLFRVVLLYIDPDPEECWVVYSDGKPCGVYGSHRYASFIANSLSRPNVKLMREVAALQPELTKLRAAFAGHDPEAET